MVKSDSKNKKNQNEENCSLSRVIPRKLGRQATVLLSPKWFNQSFEHSVAQGHLRRLIIDYNDTNQCSLFHANIIKRFEHTSAQVQL